MSVKRGWVGATLLRDGSTSTSPQLREPPARLSSTNSPRNPIARQNLRQTRIQLRNTNPPCLLGAAASRSASAPPVQPSAPQLNLRPSQTTRLQNAVARPRNTSRNLQSKPPGNAEGLLRARPRPRPSRLQKLPLLRSCHLRSARDVLQRRQLQRHRLQTSRSRQYRRLFPQSEEVAPQKPRLRRKPPSPRV